MDRKQLHLMYFRTWSVHVLFSLSYVVHHLSVAAHRPLNRNHTNLFLYRNYSRAPIISFLITFRFLWAKQGFSMWCRWWWVQIVYKTDTKTLALSDDKEHQCQIWFQNRAMVSEKEEFKDTKVVIIFRISKKSRQHNDQSKSAKGQRTIYQTWGLN